MILQQKVDHNAQIHLDRVILNANVHQVNVSTRQKMMQDYSAIFNPLESIHTQMLGKSVYNVFQGDKRRK